VSTGSIRYDRVFEFENSANEVFVVKLDLTCACRH